LKRYNAVQVVDCQIKFKRFNRKLCVAVLRESFAPSSTIMFSFLDMPVDVLYMILYELSVEEILSISVVS
jgi:hypothetical protein